MIKKILIANRGEIALRVIRSCRLLGIQTVAVFSEADRNALHAQQADEALSLGGLKPSESYLMMDKLISAAKQSGADAIHPGYGFLSENAVFSKTCAENGITFIGPDAKAMRIMGDKLQARNAMINAGVPIAPGTREPVTDAKTLEAEAKKIGFPVMLKAVGGGGGKGIRIVREQSELVESWERAASEAATSFGRADIYLEKYIGNPRHIEIQILADGFGNAVHFGERECSVQRRHQKLIEESPSAALSAELREQMGNAAVKAALAVGYRNAGTFEFLLDHDGKFYFMEMNTRLQVEHTVTEMVTGFDLVAEQIFVASGKKLRMKQSDIRHLGHAMELRICSEDPQNNFAPSIGRIQDLELPSGPHIRWDGALFNGLDVTLYYDSMLGKLIAWGLNRDECIARLKQALKEFRVGGVRTTIPLFERVLEDKEFLSSAIHTNWLDLWLKREEKQNRNNVEIGALAVALFHAEKSQRPASKKNSNYAKNGNGNGHLPEKQEDAWIIAGRKRAMRRVH